MFKIFSNYVPSPSRVKSQLNNRTVQVLFKAVGPHVPMVLVWDMCATAIIRLDVAGTCEMCFIRITCVVLVHIFVIHIWFL